MKLALNVESEHYVDLEGISELIGSNWIHRDEIEDNEFSKCERTMFKTEDGYWCTIVKGRNK